MLVESAHAKLNLSLAVTGRRPDGFHELVSLVVSIGLADHLDLRVGQPLALTCDDPSVPVDESNLVLKAARAYLRHRPGAAVGHFHLTKRVPHGAGLGGGSADAAAALRLLDRAAESPLGTEGLMTVAAEVGSDCPYFIRGRSAIMRGRGERLEVLPESVRQSLLGRRVLVIKPPFGVPTPEAYGLVAQSGEYVPADAAEKNLAAWMGSPASDPSRLGNSLERPVFRKYLALPAACGSLLREHQVGFHMTGSGSACFALVGESLDSASLFALLRTMWGPGSWAADTRISA